MQATDPIHDRIGVTAAIACFEDLARMRSGEFRRRFLDGEFGRVAWARTWFSLLR